MAHSELRRKQERKDSQMIIVLGELNKGFKFYGPLNSAEADKIVDEELDPNDNDWYLAELLPWEDEEDKLRSLLNEANEMLSKHAGQDGWDPVADLQRRIDEVLK